jgi:hypothetical protein
MATLREQFVAFRAECIWLRDCYNTFTTLFDEDETRQLLERSAAIFFGDLNRVLQEYCYLQVCKITDPAETGGRANLTVKALNNALDAAGLLKLKPEIEQHAAVMMRYRGFIKAPRNRLISHLDTKTILKGDAIGGHDPHEVTAFFEAMQNYCDEVGRVVGEGPLDFRWSAGAGDVIDLLRVLRKTSPTIED